VWCDVKDSWDADKHPKLTVEEMVKSALQHPGRLIVITGGEPLMHDLEPLTNALRAKGFTVNIETSGAHPLSGQLDWICLSPKKFKEPLSSVVPLANELKVVIFHKSDFAWAEAFAAQVSPSCKLYLQPEWDKREQMTPLIIDYIHNNPKWGLSLQTHKYIGVP
jgi:organic radical activating enzyme